MLPTEANSGQFASSGGRRRQAAAFLNCQVRSCSWQQCRRIGHNPRIPQSSRSVRQQTPVRVFLKTNKSENKNMNCKLLLSRSLRKFSYKRMDIYFLPSKLSESPHTFSTNMLYNARWGGGLKESFQLFSVRHTITIRTLISDDYCIMHVSDECRRNLFYHIACIRLMLSSPIIAYCMYLMNWEIKLTKFPHPSIRYKFYNRTAFLLSVYTKDPYHFDGKK